MERRNIDEEQDVYIISKGQKVSLTIREIKHLRRAIHQYDFRRDKTSSLYDKLKKLGFNHSMRRKPKMEKSLRDKAVENGCVVCGENDREKLVVHHIIPSSARSSNNKQINVLCLCEEHHIELHEMIVDELGRKYVTGVKNMKKAYTFNLTVLPENLEKVKELLLDNKELFQKTLWNQTEVQIV